MKNSMSKESYAEHTVAWDSITKSNYNLAGIETKYLPIQTEVVSDDKDQTINKLKQRIAELEEQLKNCVRPKFKIGQEVWSIFENRYFRDCKELCNLEITAIMKTNKGIFYQGYVLEQGKNRSDYWFDENNTFLNKAETQERLQELKGD